MVSHYFIFCLIHPLVICTIALICGIACKALLISISPYAFLMPALIIGALGMLLSSKKNIPLLFYFLPFFFFLGTWRYNQQQEQFEALYTIIGRDSFDAIGRVITITRQDNQYMNYCTIVELQTFKSDRPLAPTKTIDDTLCIYTKYKPHIQVQDLVLLKNLRIKKTAKESFNNYLIKEGIGATVFLPKVEPIILNHPPYSFSRWLFYTKEEILRNCKEKLSKQTFSLFSSIFLGNRSTGKKEMAEPKDACKTWGISHYLARSGLHLVIIIFMWHMLLSCLPISFLAKQILIICCCIMYFLLSWSSISFIRALLTFVFYKICIILKVQAHFFYLLTLVCFLVLLSNPMQLFFLDFQLSFGLTFALLWFNSVQQEKKLSNNQNIDSSL